MEYNIAFSICISNAKKPLMFSSTPLGVLLWALLIKINDEKVIHLYYARQSLIRAKVSYYQITNMFCNICSAKVDAIHATI